MIWIYFTFWGDLIDVTGALHACGCNQVRRDRTGTWRASAFCTNPTTPKSTCTVSRWSAINSSRARSLSPAKILYSQLGRQRCTAFDPTWLPWLPTRTLSAWCVPPPVILFPNLDGTVLRCFHPNGVIVSMLLLVRCVTKRSDVAIGLPVQKCFIVLWSKVHDLRQLLSRRHLFDCLSDWTNPKLWGDWADMFVGCLTVTASNS